MNIIVATSRGRGFEEITARRDDTILSVHPGASLKKLQKEALKLLKDVPLSNENYVYFVAGLPDVTEKRTYTFYMHGKPRRYEEVTMPSTNPTKAAEDITFQFRSTAKKILKAKATPIFSTICPMSIATWNHRRLSQHRTTHLSSFKQYPTMQKHHEEVILKVNKAIHVINRKNDKHTPRLANQVIYHRKGQLRCRYGKLVDGVHPNSNLVKDWISMLDRVMDMNRDRYTIEVPAAQLKPTEEEEYDSDSSQKRSWLY